jgi:hypothetical protein
VGLAFLVGLTLTEIVNFLRLTRSVGVYNCDSDHNAVLEENNDDRS